MKTPRDIEFLTRSSCANTPEFRRQLDAALVALGLPPIAEVVDLDTLDTKDPRKAWSTPTVLIGGHDLFGMQPPSPAPSPG